MNKITVIGLGYVGLPLAIEFAKKYTTCGYDINKDRVEELKNGIDKTKEIEKNILLSSKLIFTTDKDKIKDSNVYIITVPTPIDESNNPNLSPLISATEVIGKLLNKNDIVIYESTVYPGCTENICVPILEKKSKLKFNKDFFCGYSPERISPGDKNNTLTKIKKITSGSNLKAGKIIDKLYSSIIDAGTHLCSSIKVAEACKAIENAQRDVNISFVNELALIFDRLDIDTNEVLDAAATKWNFLHYKPGLVGGHCIGVDPYYLAHRAEEVGYYPEVILSGRAVNSRMSSFVAQKTIKLMIKKGIQTKGAKVLILGISFKENCPDIRNSQVVRIYNELKDYGVHVDVVDPIADDKEVKREFNIKLTPYDNISSKYDGLIFAVAHNQFLKVNIHSYLKSKNSVLYDLKGVLKKEDSDARL
tara:strand:- start:20366 stop:21622 length:1257 start_codon:yes stop_codon:yes gene_type:complete